MASFARTSIDLPKKLNVIYDINIVQMKHSTRKPYRLTQKMFKKM